MTALVPFTDMERMAQAIVKSGLFGMKTADQVLALMLIAQAENRHPAIVARDYNIIQGRPAKTAEAMLRDFLEAGGRVEWHRLDDECADATFSHPQGGTVRISWDLARAKKAGIGGKDNYAKYTRQMLRSRTVSEGCRTVYPASTSGLYEPGEVRHIVKEDARKEKDMGAADVIDSDGVIAEPSTDSPAAIPPGSDQAGTSSAPAHGSPPLITADQAIHLEDSCKEIGMTTAALCKAAHVDRISMIEAGDYQRAVAWLDKRRERMIDSAQP